MPIKRSYRSKFPQVSTTEGHRNPKCTTLPEHFIIFENLRFKPSTSLNFGICGKVKTIGGNLKIRISETKNIYQQIYQNKKRRLSKVFNNYIFLAFRSSQLDILIFLLLIFGL